MIRTTLFHRCTGISRIKRAIALTSLVAMLLFDAGSLWEGASPTAFAAAGDNALFTFVPLYGKAGENEVKLVVNTDSAYINHLIFDIVDTGGTPVFDMDGSGDPVSFPLSGASVLGTQTGFTTASGDLGYDIASSNPTSTGAYSALNFAIITADLGLPTGGGGTLSFDTDTAIYVNAQRQGTFGDDYVVLPNEAPIISLPKVDGVDLSSSTTAPSSETPIPTTLVQDVSVSATFTFSVTDNTDASVQRRMQLYKRLDDGSWGYPASATYTNTASRSGTTMTYSRAASLEYASYYKGIYTATDDQGASDTETFYFSTQADDNAPTAVSKAFMTFIGDADTRSNVIASISFTTATDNDDISAYYLWTKAFLITKEILNSDGSRDLLLDTNADETVSDEEFYIGLRSLLAGEDYVSKVTKAEAGSTPYFRITGNDVDQTDGSNYFVPESLGQDVLYIVAADTATTIAGTAVPNFSSFTIVNKIGDFFGSQVTLTTDAGDYDYVVGDGSLDVWDAVYLYRTIIGRADTYPSLQPDYIHSNPYNLPTNVTRDGASSTYDY